MRSSLPALSPLLLFFCVNNPSKRPTATTLVVRPFTVTGEVVRAHMSKRIGGKVKNIDEHRLEISLNDVFLGQMPSPLLKCVFFV